MLQQADEGAKQGTPAEASANAVSTPTQAEEARTQARASVASPELGPLTEPAAARLLESVGAVPLELLEAALDKVWANRVWKAKHVVWCCCSQLVGAVLNAVLWKMGKQDVAGQVWADMYCLCS